MSDYLKGHLLAIGAFGFWGIVPIYWKQINHLGSIELIGHRILWGTFSLLVYLLLKKRNPIKIIQKAKPFNIVTSTVLIATNWFTFVYAVQVNLVVEASLGYFLNPLLNVVAGILIFKESPNKVKITSFILALIGVILFSTGRMGSIWVSLTLAFSFALYGIIHKKSELVGLEGLFVELCILTTFAIPVLIYLGHLNPLSVLENKGFLVFLTGPVTITPLILFMMAVKKIPLSNIGLIQYLAPIGQFALGVFIYNEAFDHMSLISFCFIWLALIIFTLNEFFKLR